MTCPNLIDKSISVLIINSKLYIVIDSNDNITTNVDITDIYPNGFKLSTKLINNDKTNANAKNFFFEWQNYYISCEQNEKSKKSTENKIPPINVAIEHIYNNITINFYPFFPHSNLPKIS